MAAATHPMETQSLISAPGESARTSEPASAPSAQKIAAITIGGGLEFFDFTVYSTFASIIGKQFFPGESELAQMMLSLAVFGVGFIARPLGGIVLGAVADRAGRKLAMTLTLWLMALGSAIFVVTPAYAQIGIAAPILIILGRLIQGFAVGGEIGASTSMLLEYATDRNRGYYGSWQLFSQALSMVCGSGLGLVLTSCLSPDALYSWGWRVPFLLGLLVIPVGSYIRRHLEETGEVRAQADHKARPSVMGILVREHWRALLVGFLFVAGGTTANYMVLHYITNYAKTVLHMPLSLGLWAGWLAAALQLALSAFMGRLSDRVGRRPVILTAGMLLCLLVVPAFMLMDHQRTLGALFIAVAMLIAPLVASSVAGVVMVTELFPKSVRATGLSLVYGLAVAIFGGFAQFNATWLVKYTGSNLAPAWYTIALLSLAMVAVFCSRETAGRPLD